MASADNKRKNGFNAPAVVLCGLAAVIFALAMGLFMSGGFNALVNRETQTKIYATEISDEAQAQLAAQQDLLHQEVRYLDEEKGVLSMPIEDAMERVVARNAR